MKTCAKIVILLMALGMGVAARAQTCTTPVTAFQGQFTISGSGTGTDATGMQWTVNETASYTVNMPLQQLSCTAAAWVGPGMPLSGSVNDFGSRPCPPPGGQETTTISGSVVSFPSSPSAITIDPSSGMYTFFPSAIANVALTFVDCNGQTTTINLPYRVIPANWLLPNAPPSFPLPITPQSLTANMPNFQGSWVEGGVGGASFPITWNFSFTLDPIDDDCPDCKQQGGGPGDQGGEPFDMPAGPLDLGGALAGVPVSSSIICQNQSLGEDVPIVDTGFHLHYESGRAPGSGGNTVASSDAGMIGGWTLSAHHAYDLTSNTLFLGDGSQRSPYELGAPIPFNGNSLVTFEDGSEVYVFNASGQHLQTVRPLTGALEYQFGYDAAGKLVTVTDANGNVTTIQRDASEHPTAIVSPYGQTTTLSVDPNGFLSQVTDPFGKSATFTNSSTGLLASRTDQNGNSFNYTYDAQGRLTKDADSLGGFVSMTRTNGSSGFGWTVGETTSMGRTRSYQSTLTVPWVQTSTSTFSKQHTNTWPNGLQAASATTQQVLQISKSVTLPDGTSNSDTLGPDPVWGLQVPVTTSRTLTEGNLTMNISGSRTATLGTTGDPFSLLTATDTTTINGRTYTSVISPPSASPTYNRTLVDTTPMGRKLTTVLDNQERITRVQLEGLLPSDFGYDLRGRLLAVTQGTRRSTFTYDSNGRMATSTDPLGRKNSFSYDADGRLLSTTLPDGRVIGYQYDANGNLTAVIPPGKSAHSFTYTAVNEVSQYLPPSVSGAGATTYAYNNDRDTTQITRPDLQTIGFGYDTAGRLSSLTTPSETIGYTYDSTTGNLSSASVTGGEALSYGYNGPLLTSISWTGTVAGSVGLAYNNNFWTTSQSLNGSNTIAFTYDNDGLVTNAGALTLNRSPLKGLITGSTLGLASDSRSYNAFGELTGYTASFNGVPLYGVNYTRDSDGRVSRKTETLGGQTNTYAYSYDLAGRLVGVSQNGTPVSSYSYDTNSSRVDATTQAATSAGPVSTTQVSHPRYAPGRVGEETLGSHTYASSSQLDDRLGALSQDGIVVLRYSHVTTSNPLNPTPLAGTVSATYDAQDRLLSYGATTYTYTANGELASQTAGGQTTSYQYDVLGNLVSVTLPSGTAISYVVDAQNRRVGKKVNGTSVAGFLYDGPRIIAELNSSNAIVSQFIYASRPNSPDYMVSGGVTYRIFSDQLGSPRLVVNTATGAIAEQITHDEFGNVLGDTNPGFQPFGFAGGSYDQDTKLVRFGARDYDPSTGRWTAKDPILFNGGDANLYGYVLNDPVNLKDPSGLQDEEGCSCPNIDQIKRNMTDFTEAATQTAQNSATIVGAIAKLLIGYYGGGIKGAGAAGGPGPGSQGAVMSIYGALKRQIELDDLVNAKYGRPKPCHLPKWLTTSGWKQLSDWYRNSIPNMPAGGPPQGNPGYPEP